MIERDRLARMRESAAGLLYVRNRLAGDLALLRSSNAPAAEISRVARELEEAETDAQDALAALTAMYTSIRTRERERLRARAAELSVTSAALREVAEDPLLSRE